MHEYSANFSPAYAQQYLYPYRQVDPNITYPGPSVTHTVGSVGGIVGGAGAAVLGGILGAALLGVWLPLYLLNKPKKKEQLPVWAKALIVIFLTMPAGGTLGALPGLLWAGSSAAQSAQGIAETLRQDRARRDAERDQLLDRLRQPFVPGQ